MLEDKGYEYFYSYNDGYRNEVVEIVYSYTQEVVTVKNSNRKIIAFPYYQLDENRVVVHLVNYDHQFLFDLIRPKMFVKIEIQKPSFDINRVSMITSDLPINTDLDFSIEDGYVSFTVPFLKIYDVVIIE
jgi:hypothetical protein